MSIQALIQLYELEGAWSDAALVVEDKRLFVNRAILSASSSVFSELFLSVAAGDISVSSEESGSGPQRREDGSKPIAITIHLHGKSLTDVASWLAYVHPLTHDAYQPPITEETALSLLSIAEEYDCHRLTRACEDYFLQRHGARDARHGSVSQAHAILADRFGMRRLLQAFVTQIQSPSFPLYRHSTGALPPWNGPAGPATTGTGLIPTFSKPGHPDACNQSGNDDENSKSTRQGKAVHLHGWRLPVSLSTPGQVGYLSPDPEDPDICLASILSDRAQVEQLSHAALVQVVRALYLRLAKVQQGGLLAQCLLSDARRDVIAFLAPAEGPSIKMKQMLANLDHAIDILKPS